MKKNQTWNPELEALLAKYSSGAKIIKGKIHISNPIDEITILRAIKRFYKKKNLMPEKVTYDRYLDIADEALIIQIQHFRELDGE